ncbi:FkbM family methyltransferase [Gemmatimonadota bacterium]
MTNPLFWYGGEAVEGATLEVFAALLEGARCFIDVGAYVGNYSLLAGLHDGTRRVHAFEPMPDTLEVLKRNISLNGLANVEAHGAAVADEEGEIDLHIPRAGLPSSTTTRREFRQPDRTVRVPAVTLDGFAESRRLEKIDLIKIDTETSEPEVLAGARSILERHEPFIICEVLAGQREEDLERILAPLPYDRFWITSRGLVEMSTIKGDSEGRHLNYLFVPRAKREMILAH